MKHVKTHLVPKALSRATIVLALLTASASAHPGHPGHDIARRQMNGFGGMLSFVPIESTGIEVQKRFRLIKPSMSLGGLETISSSPAHTSHRHLGPEGRAAEGIPEELIRLTAGIEDPEDLIADLDQALG